MTATAPPHAPPRAAPAADTLPVGHPFNDGHGGGFVPPPPLAHQERGEQGQPSAPPRRFVDEEVLPAINEYWEAAELPWPLMRRLADLGLYGEDIEGYGCPGMSPLARGLVNMELHRGDGSLGTFLGVQSGLAMKSIDLLGSDERSEERRVGKE